VEIRNLYVVDDAVRASAYAQAALSIVGADARVTAAFSNWINTVPTTVNDDDRDRLSKEIIASLVFDDLQLRYVWLADWIETLFVWTANTRGPVWFEVEVFGIPKKTHLVKRHLWAELRKPKVGQVEQDVTYWYRCCVAQQRSTQYALGRELRKGQREARASDGHKTIAEAIRRTERVLQSIGMGGLGDPYIRLNISASGKIAMAYFAPVK